MKNKLKKNKKDYKACKSCNKKFLPAFLMEGLCVKCIKIKPITGKKAFYNVKNFKNIVKKRNHSREKLDEDHKPAYSRKEYVEKIKVTYGNLHKYYDNLNYYFIIYYTHTNFFNRFKIKIILGKKRTLNLLSGLDKFKINEVYKLFRYMNLKKDFIVYLIKKTNFSYTIFGEDPEPIDPIFRKNRKEVSYRMALKFSEFVYLILSEYVILHNWMWVGKMKLESIKSIDDWLEDIILPKKGLTK